MVTIPKHNGLKMFALLSSVSPAPERHKDARVAEGLQHRHFIPHAASLCLSQEGFQAYECVNFQNFVGEVTGWAS